LLDVGIWPNTPMIP